MNKKFDFSGYATKANVKCSDGRIITDKAFSHMNGKQVPLVWQHCHSDPTNILGHAILEHKNDGVYAYCKFNDTPNAIQAKSLVQHGDINSLSIHANQLTQNGSNVLHGDIKEVSLVISGANPGAKIDNISIQHSDGTTDMIDDEAIIFFGERIQHNDEQNIEDITHADDETIGDIMATLNDKQKIAVYAMITAAASSMANNDTQEMKQSDIGGEEEMKHNVFDKTSVENTTQGKTLTHDDLRSIVSDMKNNKKTLRQAFLEHTTTYGIENIESLFPDPRDLTKTPEWTKRNTEWVSGVLNGVKKSPFSRIRTRTANITADEARAKGYVKGALKKEEWFTLASRTTSPTTIYKKQKFDKDDIDDLTSFDVIAWVKGEMRMMLDEEIARAILLGDGREIEDEDKIKEDCIRPIYKENDVYAPKIEVAADKTTEEIMEDILRASKQYKGSGSPTFYTTKDFVIDMMLLKDTTGRKLYSSINEIAMALKVSNIVEVEVMENVSRVDRGNTLNLIGIVVNLNDYNVGSDKNGKVDMFDDFDIDYNQFKYLIETRLSGALTAFASALVIEQLQGA